MTASLAAQYLVVAIAVLVSAWVVAVKQFPHATRRTRIAIAMPLLRDERPAWMRSIARRIAPLSLTQPRGACGGCDSCGPSPKA